jgi:predicted lipoprotein with Yx(FWY)xxD motif
MPYAKTALRRQRRASRGPARLLLPTAVFGAALALTAIALGAKGAQIVGSAHSSALGEQVVVDARGNTLYALSSETPRHLLCTSKECLRAWPPLTVSSHKAKLKAGAGVKGKLGLVRRKRGVFQVTLRGMLLYRFAGDHAPGEANGQGIQAFGGTWSAMGASRSSHNGRAGNPPAGGAPEGAGNANNGSTAPPTPGSSGTLSTSSTVTSTATTSSSSTTTTTTYSY